MNGKVTAYIVDGEYVKLGNGEHFYIVGLNVAQETARNAAYPWEIVYIVANRVSAAVRQARRAVQGATTLRSIRRDDGYPCQHCGKLGGH